MTKKQKKLRNRLVVVGILYFVILIIDKLGTFDKFAQWIISLIYLVPFILVAYDVFIHAFKNIGHGRFLDERFLMVIATVAAFCIGECAEGVAAMLFYQVGELFEDYAVNRSRESIKDLMSIAPEYANIEKDGHLVQVDPYDVAVGQIIVVKPGEKVPLDGVVVKGTSFLDTAALTGEPVKRSVTVGDEVISGCVNENALLHVQTTKEYDDCTVAKILDMVENASNKKAHVENFITKFARYYTPLVVAVAAALAVIGSFFFAGGISAAVYRACIFLVVSCPCALVISVPLSFFGGIGAASRRGILVKGRNFLEAMANTDTIVFDKTGTLTHGTFRVEEVFPKENREEILYYAALCEGFSNHPIAISIREAWEEQETSEGEGNPVRADDAGFTGKVNSLRNAVSTDHAAGKMDTPGAAGDPKAGKDTAKSKITGKSMAGLSGLNLDLVADDEEIAGRGVRAVIEGKTYMAGNEKMMEENGIAHTTCTLRGTAVYLARENEFLGWILIMDAVKEEAKGAIAALHTLGIKRTVMLTGDRSEVAESVAKEVGIDIVCSQLLPGDKVEQVQKLLEEEGEGKKLAFVGDGINDAPVLMRSDVGIAMGSMGSDAAIEAADVVLMDDDISKIATIINISRKTLRIAKFNIVFAIGVKVLVLILGAAGIANMWLAIFADVGVAFLAILNSMRTMRVK